MPFVEHPIIISTRKLVKLKSSIVYKFFNAQWKFSIVIAQSKTEIVQSIFQISCLNGCFWKYKILSSNEVVSFQIFRELYSWTITFEIYHIIFLVFSINCNKVSYLCSTNAVCSTVLKRHSICDGSFYFNFRFFVIL